MRVGKNESDFRKATRTIYLNNKYERYIELPVIKQ